MMIRKTVWLLLLFLLCAALSGCRTRVTGNSPNGQVSENETAASFHPALSGFLPEDRADEQEAEKQEKSEETGGRTKENPEASRKEYDENAPAEIVPGTERTVHGAGEGGGASAANKNADKAVSRLNDAAEETATQTVSADRAEQMGVSQDAREADSALTYFTVLLQDRMGSLFECQRLTVYWETREDHVTVFKTSLEHSLILNAGAYDVSARLLPENLRVDDGWIGRKNPGVIVKAVDGSVLGAGVFSTGAARKVYADLLTRDGFVAIDAVRSGRVILLSEELLQAPYLQTAAMLAIAKAAYPASMADVDIEQAIGMLAQEATGSIPSGIYYFCGQGGFQ